MTSDQPPSFPEAAMTALEPEPVFSNQTITRESSMIDPTLPGLDSRGSKSEGAVSAAPHTPESMPTPASAPSGGVTATAAAGTIMRVHPSECMVWDKNPRRFDWLTDESCADLIDDIDQRGVQIPLIGRRVANAAHQFEILTGSRRLYSANRVVASGKAITVPVEIRVISDEKACVLVEAENRGRTSPSAIELARGYERQLSCFAGGQNAFARSIGIDKGDFSKLRSLLLIPDEVLEVLIDPRDMSANQGATIARHCRDTAQRASVEKLVASITDEGVKVSAADFVAKLRKPAGAGLNAALLAPITDENGVEMAKIDQRSHRRLQITIEDLSVYTVDQRRAIVKEIAKRIAQSVVRGH